MEIDVKEIGIIRNKFSEMQTKEDLLDLLNFTKKIIYGKRCKLFSIKELNYFTYHNLCEHRYKEFVVRKKSGGFRIINAPIKKLKSILKVLNVILQIIDKPHGAANGFVKGKSIVDNARKHVGKYYVYNSDLKDFFHSFDRNKVKLAFMFGKFNLKDREKLAYLLASLCTHSFKIDGEIKAVLPQGAPTSPTITNIICKRLDKRLSGLAKRFGANYSRYADDLTFSSNNCLYANSDSGYMVLNEFGSYDAFIPEFKRLIGEENLKINEKKTRLHKPAYRQEVTGLTVNQKINVPIRYIKQLRMWLYYWEKYGYVEASRIFHKDYIKDKGHIKTGKEHFENVLDGKLLYLKMVKGENDSTYIKLRKRFDKLASNETSEKKELQRISNIKVNTKLEEFVNSGFNFELL